MMSVIITSLRISPSIRLAACSQRRYLAYVKRKNNEKLEEKARSLIFGEKQYVDFSLREKKIVDLYQKKRSREDAIILPNTGSALEEAEVYEMLLKRQHKIWDRLKQEGSHL
jgi:hypothetical protein